ncbi:MAG: transcription antitermination factor NusB [Bacteroidales bacterium]|nr:transcription antitermination factor NusB [Bacteroidales bacterium]
MISRRHIRIKVMQALYAFNTRSEETATQAENELFKTVENCHVLFVWIFSILPEVVRYRTNKLESFKEKNNPTYEDLNPNTKFIDNKVISQIEDNKTLQSLIENYRILWDNDQDFIISVFKEIEASEYYQNYMETSERSYESDKQLVLDIIQYVFGESEYIQWFFSEKDPNWVDDYYEALSMLYKNVDAFKENKGAECKIFPAFNNKQDDENLCRQLFRKVLAHNDEYEQMIEGKIQNWDMDRLIGMDILMLKMAICELTEFPLIPVKVTMNEYIEIAKMYSSDKSKLFINGVLDKIIVDLRNSGQLNKTGRGLYQN